MFDGFKQLICAGLLSGLAIGVGIQTTGVAAESWHGGLLYDSFALTLDTGHRTEAAGPFFYEEQRETSSTWALPPFFSHYTDPAVEAREDNFLYPLLTYERYGKEHRWQLGQLFSFAGGGNPDETTQKRFTLYPLYFQQRSTQTNDDYTALVPFYGHLKNRLIFHDVFFVMFPVYSETRKRDVVTDNYFYPFFHLRHGNGLHGWQFWPVVGREHKDITSDTNGFGDVTLGPGHDKSFVLWPFYFNQHTGIGSENPEKTWGVIPLYLQLRSPLRDSTTVLWPFFTWIDERGKKYHEWQGPWPFVIFTRGEGKTTSRVWPIFSRSHNQTQAVNSYLWPLYHYHRLHSDPLDMQRTRIMFYLYEDTVERNTQTGANKRRVDMWPFFTWHRDFNGNTRLQILAPLEPALPNQRGIERNWSPLWSVWRSEQNPRTGAASQSLLWNLYRRDRTPDVKNCSLLFGLFQYQFSAETKRVRLFYVPVFKSHSNAGQPVK